MATENPRAFFELLCEKLKVIEEKQKRMEKFRVQVSQNTYSIYVHNIYYISNILNNSGTKVRTFKQNNFTYHACLTSLKHIPHLFIAYLH